MNTIPEAPSITTNVGELTDADRTLQSACGGDPRRWLKAGVCVSGRVDRTHLYLSFALSADELRDLAQSFMADADELDRQACELVCTPKRSGADDAGHFLPCPTAETIREFEADAREVA